MGVGTSWSLRFTGCILRLLEARVLRGDGVGGRGRDKERGWFSARLGEARGAVVGVVRGTGRGILEIPGDRESEQGDCDGEVGAFVGVSGTVVFGGDGLVCVWTDWEGGGVFVDV